MSEDEYGARAENTAAVREAALARFVPEVKRALEAAPDVRAWPKDWDKRGAIDYFYKKKSILTGPANAANVRTALLSMGSYHEADDGDSDPAQRAAAQSPGAGMAQFNVTVREDQHTPDVLKDLDARIGRGVATHEHVFAVTGLMCPATEPEPVLSPQMAHHDPTLVREALWPPPVSAPAGEGVNVSIVDTGLVNGIAGWAPWLDGVVADTRADIDVPDRISLDPMRPTPDGFADPYAGHGSFIAGVVRCLAPSAAVTVERVIDRAGFVTELNMMTQIRQAMGSSPSIVSISAGGYTRHNAPPFALQTLWRDRLSQLDGVTFVAAAGNDGIQRPFWPAAFPWCIAVGAMSRDGQQRSWYSNHGPWVNVYAPGDDIINAYPRLKYETFVNHDVRDTSAGVVKWSGTSFAAPIVTGLIAARMSRTGENSALAAANLLTVARGQFRPDIGPRLFP
jgi:subtilisin family serine protease